MDHDFIAAGTGLKTMFMGQVLAIVAVLLGWVPFVGTLCSVVSSAVLLLGLSQAGSAHPGYRNALYMTVATLVLGVLTGVWGNVAFLGGVLRMAESIASFLAVYFVCTSSGVLLGAKGDSVQADRSTLIWELYAACAAVSIICTLVSWIPLVNILSSIAAVVMAIVAVVAAVLYFLFLYKASQSLLA